MNSDQISACEFPVRFCYLGFLAIEKEKEQLKTFVKTVCFRHVIRSPSFVCDKQDFGGIRSLHRQYKNISLITGNGDSIFN